MWNSQHIARLYRYGHSTELTSDLPSRRLGPSDTDDRIQTSFIAPGKRNHYIDVLRILFNLYS